MTTIPTESCRVIDSNLNLNKSTIGDIEITTMKWNPSSYHLHSCHSFVPNDTACRLERAKTNGGC